MAELRPFATVKQAAEIGEVPSGGIGMPDGYFVRKSELVRTGKFDTTSLNPYQPNWFVHLDAVKKAPEIPVLNVDWMAFQDVAADATEASTYLSCSGTNNDPVITVTGGLKNVTARVEKYTSGPIGWTHKVILTFDRNDSSTDLISYVKATLTDGKDTVSKSVRIVQSAAVIETLTVTPESLNFVLDGGSKDITIKTENNWEIV